VAFETHLIALTRRFGTSEVASQTTTRINLGQLRNLGRLADVSRPASGYMDFAAILSREQFAELLQGQTGDLSNANWFASLPDEVRYIVVLEAEWES
jgi:hypothetical protein